MLDIQDFSRKTFEVKAVQVNEKNIKEVAEWCGGTLAKKLDDGGDIYVSVPVKQPSNHKKTYPSRAYLNYWVLQSGTGFRVYSPTGFEVAFIEKAIAN